MGTTRTGVIGTGVVAALLMLVSAAWACTARPVVLPPSPQTGPAGTAVTIRGQAVPANGPVEIRWNALSGEPVATTRADANGHFSVVVTVPDTAPGIYPVVLSTADAAVARTVFHVTPSAATPASGGEPLWTDPAGATGPGSSLDVALVAGVALLGVGLLVSLAGFQLAAVRRRATAQTGSGSHTDRGAQLRDP